MPDEVVHLRRGEQDHVAAGDPRSDGGQCGVCLAVAPAKLDAGAVHDRSRETAEGDASLRADPAAVHGQDEEEDDAEQQVTIRL